MASPEAMAASMLKNVPEKTGKTMAEWHKILRKTSLQKHGELLDVLKIEHGVTHGFANLIVTKFRESGSEPAGDLVATQYAGAKVDLRPIYDALVNAVQEMGNDVQLAPKKAYVSLRRNKQFALIQPSTRTRVDVGLNLPEAKPGKRLEKSGSFNAMVSHRVRLSAPAEVDAELIGWLKAAYQNAS